MRERIGDRDLEYTWFRAPGHVVSRRGSGEPLAPFVDAAGVHRLSWEIFVPAVPNGLLADWGSSYSADFAPNTTSLPLFTWDRPINDPATPQFTSGNLAIADIRVWGGSANVVTGAVQPLSIGNGSIELAFRAKPNMANDPNQFDLVWRYKGLPLNSGAWNRYDGNDFNNVPFLLGERGKGLYFEVRNATGSTLNAGRLRISALAYEI